MDNQNNKELKLILKALRKKNPTTPDLQNCLIRLVELIQGMNEQIDDLDIRQGYEMSKASKLNK